MFLRTLFWLLVIVNLFANFFEWKMGEFVSKPLLLPILAAYFFFETKPDQSPFRTFLYIGMWASFLGDTFLMFVDHEPPREQFFLLGLGSFLITHVLYTIAFATYISKKKGFVKEHIYWVIPFILLFIGNSSFLWPGIAGGMKIPVLVYSLAIVSMALAALNLKGKISEKAFQLIFFGALLFVFSDSLIGINKFRGDVVEIPFVGVWIMLTYLIGQYMIAMGGIKIIKGE